MKIDSLIVVVVFAVIYCNVFPMCHGQTECVVLKRMAQRASNRRIPGFSMYCKVNTPCTGIDCNGELHLDNFGIQTEFCFGFEIQNCMKPTNIDFYSYLPQLNKSFEERLSKSNRRPIPGASVKIPVVGRVDPFANITLEDLPNNRILFGIGLNLRVTSLFGSSSWPRELQFSLIPPTVIPVAPCQHPSTTMAPPVDNKCIKVGKSSSTAVPPVATTPKHTGPKPKSSSTYSQKCDQYDPHSCGKNEACAVEGKYAGTCRCAHDTVFSKWYGHCRDNNPAPQPKPTKHSIPPTKVAPVKNGTHAHPTPKAVKTDGSNHKTIVIATCTAAAVLLLVGIAVTTVIVIRKKRARYADHDILLQNDSDTEVMT